jgi:AP-3 complex subunit beta
MTCADPASIAAIIQAIGRCAATISEVTDTCLAGLVHLSIRDCTVVSVSVLEVMKLL